MMPLAEHTEKQATKMRAEFAQFDGKPPVAFDREVADLAAYDSRPPCALTPAALHLVNQIVGRYLVRVDCGWVLHRRAYQIESRMRSGDNEYRIERLLSAFELREVHFVAAVWTSTLLSMLDAIGSRLNDAERTAIGKVIATQLAQPTSMGAQ